MNKKLIFMIVILLQAIGFQVQAQNIELLYSKHVLIGPEDVNIHYEEQADYYIQQYKSYLSEIDAIKTQAEHDLDHVKSVIAERKQKGKKIRSWGRSRSTLEEQVAKEKRTREGKRKEKHKESLKKYIKLWSDYEMTESKDVSDLSFENTCYEISGEDGIYVPGEYKALKINVNETLQWDEIKPVKAETVTRQVMVKKASSVKRQAKKRDCESPNPDDCLEWREVAIPAKYESRTERVNLGCEERGFTYQDTYDNCTNTITMNSTKKYIKVIDIQTNMEIQVIDYKAVKCE